MMDHRPSPLVVAVADTCLLWLLLVVAVALQMAGRYGFSLPLLARTTVWRLSHSPWEVAGIALTVTLATFALAMSQRHLQRASFIAGTLFGLGIAFFVAFDPGTGAAFAATAAGLYRKLGRSDRTTPAPPFRPSGVRGSR